MAAHRKSRQRPLSGGTARTAATLALAGAATATALEGSSHAEPAYTPSQVKAKIDKLYREAEVATEKYNGVKEEAGKARTSLARLQDEAARETDHLNTHRRALGTAATAQYRHGTVAPAGVQLALSSDPDQYLERARLADRAGAVHAATVKGAQHQRRELDQLRADADEQLDRLRSLQAELRRHKATVTGKLKEAERQLARLTAQERAAYTATDGHVDAGTGAASRTALPAIGNVPAPNARAAQAVAFAYRAIGSPYVWGAAGPNTFDCSGLAQAAWKAAGVSLPRTTYTQIGAGTRIPRSQLAPGDLVFFYSGISHVGIYIGDGHMIHAPRTGTTIRSAPIDQMPFAGATRPA